MPSAANWLMFKLTHLHPQVQLGVVVTLVLPPTKAFWMAHLALSVALATMVLAMSSMTVAMATGRRWGVGLGSSETNVTMPNCTTKISAQISLAGL